MEFEIKMLRTALAVNLDLTNVQTARLQQLHELDEEILDAIHQTTMIQQQITSGMIKSSSTSSSKKAIGLYCIILGLKNFKGSYVQDGWDLMK